LIRKSSNRLFECLVRKLTPDILGNDDTILHVLTLRLALPSHYILLFLVNGYLCFGRLTRLSLFQRVTIEGE
jgi:hypothetical protein